MDSAAKSIRNTLTTLYKDGFRADDRKFVIIPGLCITLCAKSKHDHICLFSVGMQHTPQMCHCFSFSWTIFFDLVPICRLGLWSSCMLSPKWEAQAFWYHVCLENNGPLTTLLLSNLLWNFCCPLFLFLTFTEETFDVGWERFSSITYWELNHGCVARMKSRWVLIAYKKGKFTDKIPFMQKILTLVSHDKLRNGQ